MSGPSLSTEYNAARAGQRGERLSVLVPCHNEAGTIVELLKRVSAALPLAEIIIVDDGSTDGSADLIRQLAQNLHVSVLVLSKRSGKGAAIRAGLSHVTREWVVIQDADLEYCPEDLRHLAIAAEAHPGCAVYGSRYLHRGRAEGGAFAPYLGVKILGILVKLLYGNYLYDAHTCYKLLPTELFRQLSLESEGFEVCAEITSKLLRKGIPILEVPISYHPRTTMEGKKIGWLDFFLAVASYFRWRFANLALPDGERGGPLASLRKSPASVGYVITRFLTGTLLVVAGGLKLAPARELPLTDHLILSQNTVLVIGMAEFLLGLLVLSFAAVAAIHWSVLATFSGYICVLSLQLLAGESVCQCLGSRPLPLLWMLVLDGVLLVAAVCFQRNWRQPLPRVSNSFLGDVLSLTRYALPALVLLGVIRFGSLDAAMSYVSGARLLPTSSTRYAGHLQDGQIALISFDLTNYSDQSVQVLGAKSTCNCMALKDLPLEFAPGASGTVRISLRATGGNKPQLQRESATLIFDDPARMLTLTVTASVTPSNLLSDVTH